MELKKPGDTYLKKKKLQPTTDANIDTSVVDTKKTTAPSKPKHHSKNKFRLPLIISLCIIAVAAIACGIIFLISSFSSNKGRLESDLERLGRNFYESYYHEQISAAYDADKLKDFLSKYESIGIKVNLDNLERYPATDLDNKAIIAEFKNSKTDEPCDPTATKISIFPIEPYGKTDYRLETTLACGFED